MGTPTIAAAVSPLPLQAWGIVAIVCALILLGVVVVMLRTSGGRRVAGLAIALAILNGALARYSLTLFGEANALGGCRGVTADVCAQFYTDLSRANTIITLLGIVAIIITLATVFGAIRLRRGDGASYVGR